MQNFKKQFGGKLTKELTSRYQESSNWKDGQFQNLEYTSMDINFHSMPKLLYKQFFDTKGREPKKPIPVLPFDLNEFLLPSTTPKFIWYGHSVLLMQWNNKVVLIDPMLGPNASPIAPFATKRFSTDTLEVIDKLPPFDAVLLTHDHYDHLDLKSILKLKGKTQKWFVALGVGRHLESWGIPADAITEFDWWDEADLDDLHFTFTPSRHFSGRGLKDRAKSLWGGWAIQCPSYNFYWSGDGGYGDHFKAVGEKFGSFDFGFMECGQYNKNWHQIHMYPEEAVQAALDAGVKKAMAVHWAGFALAQHTWKDPIIRFTKEAKSKGLAVLTPQIGELIDLDSTTTSWWDDVE